VSTPDEQLAAAAEAIAGQCARSVRAILEKDNAAGILGGLLRGELAVVVARDQVSVIAVHELPVTAGILAPN